MASLSRCYWSLPLSLALLLAGCGGSSGDDPDPRAREQVDYSHLQWEQETAEPLSNEHGSEAVADYLRNGLRLQLGQGSGGEVAISQPEAVADNATSSADGAGFSTTNVHVAGVEEADRLKYDGRHLFVAESPQFSFQHFAGTADIAIEPGGVSESPEQALRIFRTDPANGDASPVARYRFEREEDTSWRLSQLYTLGEPEQTEAVAALSEGGETFAAPAPDIATSLPYGYGYGSGSTRVEVVDVRAPANPVLSWTLEVEGQLVRSRKVGDILYLVSRSGPRWPAGLAFEEGASVDNEQRIEQAGLAELLPAYRIDGGAEQPLVSAGECYLPESLEPDRAHRSVLTVAAFDLNQRERVSAACVSAPLSGLYMSSQSLYLASSNRSWSEESRTALHKFTVDGGDIDYRGTGVVPGYLQSSDPAFNLDEDGDYLRVVATQPNGSGDFDHRLLVLREGEDRTLELVAQLPNEQQPEPIGKPGEQIYAVRFLGDRAYLVTFRQIDPLYALDLSDNEQPQVIGELEIPGVSNYLHPIEEGYLVSVGREADEDGRVQGIKIELFDVRGDNPTSLASHIVGSRGSWSQALYDLKAFSFLRVSDDQLRFALPISRMEDYDWRDSGLHLFEVNNLTGDTARLETVGQLIAESSNSGKRYPSGSGSPRSRLHAESVFYLHGNDLWAGFWDEPDTANGPIGF